MNGAILLLKSLVVLILFFVGIVLILLAAGPLSLSTVETFLLSPTGEALLLSFGAVLLVIGLYFIGTIYRMLRAAGWFLQEGESGWIALSPWALREFIGVILRQELGIARFRVQLAHSEGGIAIRVNTALSADQKVGEVSRRIQEVLAERVRESTGIEVHRVSVLVRNIRNEEASNAD